MEKLSPVCFGRLRTLLCGAAQMLRNGQPIFYTPPPSKGLITLMCGLLFAAVSAGGQTVLSNANLTAFTKALAAGGTVTFDFDGTITVTNCFTITNSVTVDGSGHAVTISGGTNSEIFAVVTNADLVLRTLTIANGLSTNESPGAITNAGILAAYDCVFSNNSSQTPVANSYASDVNAPGGAIFNAGSMLVSNSSFVQNSTFGGWGYFLTGGFIVVPALGGAIYNVGTAVVADCTFSGNSAVGGNGILGDGANGSPSVGGGQGLGGAIFNTGAIILSNSTFVHNLSSGGVGGIGSGSYPWAAAGLGAPGGTGGGGAIYSVGSTIVVNSTFLSNSAVGGAGGAGGNASSIQSPYPNGGNGGNGGNGVGGAICLSNGFLLLTNVTFATNIPTAGLGGAGGPGWFRGGATGANGTSGLALGATAANWSGTLSALNTIFCVQSNSINFYGPVTDLGYNIASDQNASLTKATSLNGVDPLLGTLGYYGGNTQTIPLLSGSPAIDGGDPNAFPPVDQRGRHRPSGPAPDIGAFEYTFPTFDSLSVNDSGAQLTVLGETGETCVIDVSSNLVDWSALMTNSFGVTNAIEILDTTAPSSGGRYYRTKLE